MGSGHADVTKTAPPGGSEPDTSMTAVVGVVFAILLFVVVVLLQAYFYRQETEENLQKVVAVAPEELAELRAQQQEALATYRWVDDKRGVVTISIQCAMALVVRDGGRSPWPQVQPPAAPAPTATKPGAPTVGKKK
ncbi:MAG: hypothetical protein ACHQQS_15575 [Thermoanaerobaculales bacterium]